MLMPGRKVCIGICSIAVALIIVLSALPMILENQDETTARTLQVGEGSLMVTVLVNESDMDRPIEGALVTVWDNISAVSNQTIENGTCIIHNLTEGAYEVNASMPGYKTLDPINVIISAGNRTNTTIWLGATSITGQVTLSGSGNEPIADATIIVFGISPAGTKEFETQSESDGWFLVKGVPLGSYWVVASKFGYQSANKTVVVDDLDKPSFGINLQLSFLGYSAGAISGYILETDKSIPVPQAEVSIVANDVKITATSDVSGKYLIPNIPPGNYTVTAVKEGYDEGVYEGVIVENETETPNINITLQAKPGRLSGTVTSGLIIVFGATVEIVETGLSDITGSQGTYAIEDVPAGNYSVNVTATGYYQLRITGVNIERGQDYELNIILEAKPGQLMGVVRSADSLVVLSSANVTVSSGNDIRHTLTNDQGQYVFGGLPEGSYTIIVRYPEYSPFIESGINVTAENTTTFDVQMKLVKGALRGFISGMDLAHSLMALAFLMTIVILAVAVYLRLRWLQQPDKTPTIFEEEDLEEEEEEEADEEE